MLLTLRGGDEEEREGGLGKVESSFAVKSGDG